MNMKKLVVVLGALLAVVVTSSWLSAQSLQGNPKRGQALYEQHCLRCHGSSGDGLGPEARGLIVPPANFHLGKHAMKTDQELFIAISDGVLFSPMHGWRGRLSRDEIMDVIGYLRVVVPFLPVS